VSRSWELFLRDMLEAARPESAAWKLTPGALSEPVPARGGLHLLPVAEKREVRIPRSPRCRSRSAPVSSAAR
jgi:hypothetical protein